MEKYGFVYIWFDKKRKMYYVGCHWGSVNDRYICSSNRMRDAYRRRPNDFKRRILTSDIESREKTFDIEHQWFSMIKNEELGKKYYNLRNHKWGHWASDKIKKQSIGQIISEKNKGMVVAKDINGNTIVTKVDDPRWLSGELDGITKGAIHSEEAKLKMSERKKGIVHTVQMREKMKIVMKGKAPWNSGKKLTEDQKERKRETLARNKSLGINKRTASKVPNINILIVP